MPKPFTAVAAGFTLGAACGAVFGAGAAFLHLNALTLVVRGVALTPTITGLLLGSLAGLLIGLAAATRRSRVQ